MPITIIFAGKAFLPPPLPPPPLLISKVVSDDYDSISSMTSTSTLTKTELALILNSGTHQAQSVTQPPTNQKYNK